MSSLTKTAKGGVEMCNPVLSVGSRRQAKKQMHISESVKLLFLTASSVRAPVAGAALQERNMHSNWFS